MMHTGNKKLNQKSTDVYFNDDNTSKCKRYYSLQNAQTAFNKRENAKVINIVFDAISSNNDSKNDSTQTTLSRDADYYASLFNLRALAYGRMAKFDLAHADAITITNIYNEQALGYLCAAQLYSMQGHQKKVVQACKQGIHSLHCQQGCRKEKDIAKLFEKLQENAKQRLEIRIDFVARLPPETLEYIFIDFSRRDLAMTTLVSPTWHGRITQCGLLWRCLLLMLQGGDEQEVLWLTAPCCGHYVRELYYNDVVPTASESNDDSYDPLVHTLQVQCIPVDQKVNSYISYRGYHSGFNTSLMKYRLGYDTLSFGRVLATFPNLTRMKFSGSQDKDPNLYLSKEELLSTMGTPQQFHQLTSLEIQIHDGVSTEQIDAMLRCCPAITRLAIATCGWDALAVIQQYPKIRVVVLNNEFVHWKTLHFQRMSSNTPCSATSTMTHGKITENTNGSTTTTGLRSLVLQALTRDNFRCYDVAPLITANSHTLEELIIATARRDQKHLYNVITKTVRWKHIFAAARRFDNLRRLFCVVPQKYEREFASMLRQCPLLVDCAIIHPRTIPGIILDTLAAIPDLRRLSLTFGFGGGIDVPAFQRLLLGGSNNSDNNHNPQQQQQQMMTNTKKQGIQHLCFRSCPEIPDDILNIVATTPSTTTLRGVEFSLNTDLLSWYAMKRFLWRIDQLASIEWIIFNCVEFFEYENNNNNGGDQDDEEFEGGEGTIWMLQSEDGKIRDLKLRRLDEAVDVCDIPYCPVVALVDLNKWPDFADEKEDCDDWPDACPGRTIYTDIEKILNL